MLIYTTSLCNSTIFRAVAIPMLHFGRRLLWTWRWQP